MKTTLTEIIRNSQSLFKFLVVEETGTETEVRAMTDCKTILMWCVPHAPLFEFEGEVAIPDLGLLSGLLGFSSYTGDGATLTVDMAKRKGRDVPVGIQFGNGKGAVSRFRLNNPATIKDDLLPPSEQEFPKEIEFEPEKAKVQEFSQLASLYGKLAEIFTPMVKDGNLYFRFGDDNSSTHSADMIFQEGVNDMRTGPSYSIGSFQNLIKLASPYPYRISLTARGAIGFYFDTAHASYKYLLRPNK